MSQLSELYGLANVLPSSPARHLGDVIDGIVSLPPGERSPNVRIWGDPNATYIQINSFPMQEIHWQGMTNVEAIDFYDSQLDRFPSFTGMTRLTHLGMDTHSRALAAASVSSKEAGRSLSQFEKGLRPSHQQSRRFGC